MAEAVEKAYRTIRDGIISGAYGPGSHLTAQDLAGASGLSRTPVREAMRRLHSEGLITFIPHRGAFVSRFELKDIHKLYDLRVVLEGYAAESAAVEATDAQVDELDVLATTMEDSVAQQRPSMLEEVPGINSEFHKLIVASAANPRLGVALAAIVEAPLVLRTFRRYSLSELQRSASQHRELVSALQARDGTWARSVMTSHILSGRNALIRSLESLDS